jgi:hypothetical protein
MVFRELSVRLLQASGLDRSRRRRTSRKPSDRRKVLRGSGGPEHGPTPQGREEALDLYHKLPPPADDHDVVVAALDQIGHDLQEIAQKVTALAVTLKGSQPGNAMNRLRTMPIVDPPTIPWYKSQVLWGLISVILKRNRLWAVFKWSHACGL